MTVPKAPIDHLLEALAKLADDPKAMAGFAEWVTGEKVDRKFAAELSNLRKSIARGLGRAAGPEAERGANLLGRFVEFAILTDAGATPPPEKRLRGGGGA